MASGRTDHLVLYTNHYSLCSIMTRFTIALRGKVGPNSVPITVEEREVDIIHRMEQMEEQFMLEVNSKGQVLNTLSKPIRPVHNSDTFN